MQMLIKYAVVKVQSDRVSLIQDFNNALRPIRVKSNGLHHTKRLCGGTSDAL